MYIKNKFYFLIFLFSCCVVFSQNESPVLTANSRQIFCPQTQIEIAPNFTISDSDNTSIALLFVQISSGYQINFDELSLVGTHPTINTNWNASEGKLTLSGIGSDEILLTNLERAVRNIVFKTTATSIVNEKFFSFTISEANYLPSTNHFYEYVAEDGITWSNARTAAQNKTFYGLKGYLATLATEEEAILAGEQAIGTGWIGATDQTEEGVWKWVTGPEPETIFWNGKVNGSTPNYANWNNNEPNNFLGDENYAHITDPNIGIRGAWNDLPNIGGVNEYVPKGYIVEYGGSIGDPTLQISASTSIYLPKINTTTNAVICESGIATLTATPTEGIILWYDALNNGNLLQTGSSFTTPTINATTTYYATISIDGCTSFNRTPITVTVNKKPTISVNLVHNICVNTAVSINASVSAGTLFWYDSPTSTIPLFEGNVFTTPILSADKTYYLEAKIADCVSDTRTAVKISTSTNIPEFNVVKQTVVFCLNSNSVTLETENPQGNYTYQWKRDNAIITGNSASIMVSSTGNYTVKAISNAGCESVEKSILVVNSEIAKVTKESIVIKDNSSNNTIEIITDTLGIGDYEFSLDDEFGDYQSASLFENIETGTHNLFIRDKKGCGTVKYVFSILKYTEFFTPNEDGINDFWHIKGYNKDVYAVSDITIYNRFGVLLFKIDNLSLGWDGKYQGKKMPSNTYWFRATLTDTNGFSTKKSGNFSLIR
ncbi:T9SS type B sorting domain-containing protein [Polaribacter sp. PL03]|uniref:Ig-like domain-containing protein n=1 Tax=Polaribacter sp. PL03 TaxID=3088353 RepID=UPI0029CFD5C1|nr:T9SS type B sorting domain-containing protein [Polaribacter sp. PL03]MDX6746626.1 T9SS type B sorting domain-containing protein [Polaribacter sp. PL03]